ncbi:MAG: isochorismatase family protein [Rhodoferax sp.]|nr:isochorismatase family protein [Rhodoferax sp.]
MNRIRLFVIDPQNDFMDIPGASLPVPGASADMQRLAQFMDTLRARIDDLVVTLDSHASVGIERTPFWVTPEGAEVAPFTQILAQDVRAQRYLPRHRARLADVLVYLDALEAAGSRRLIAWPVHCVVGDWGHNLYPEVAASIARWELASDRSCDKVLKGRNPMTEQYSAFRAEVPRADDPSTQNNRQLMARLGAGDAVLVVAGEALSHCVAASGEDMLAQLDDTRLRNTILLTDCMSSIPGFEAAGKTFLQQARARGVRTMGAAEAAVALNR